MKILNKLMERKKDIWLKSPFVQNPTQQAFKVNKETNLWYCFETQQSGNLTDFIMTLSKMNFKEPEETKWIPISKKPKEESWYFLCRDTDTDDTRMTAIGVFENGEWQEPIDMSGFTHYVIIKEPKNFPKTK